ncbi:MAG: flagellar basal body rod C-terminal domain-containing protein [Nitrospirota bacterium]
MTASTLEASNVDLGDELVNMIIMQRGFQANSRIITTTNDLLGELVNLAR